LRAKHAILILKIDNLYNDQFSKKEKYFRRRIQNRISRLIREIEEYYKDSFRDGIGVTWVI
jgi:hypothetical protein